MPSAPMTSAVPGQCRRSAVSVVLFVSVEPQVSGGRARARGARAEAETAPRRRARAPCARPMLLMIDPPVAVAMRRSVAGGPLPVGYRLATAPRRRDSVVRLELVFRILGPLEVMLALRGRSGSAARGSARCSRSCCSTRTGSCRSTGWPTSCTARRRRSPRSRRCTGRSRSCGGLLEPERAAGAAGAVIETRPPGYRIRVAPDALDLQLFERRAERRRLGARGRRRRDGRPALPGGARASGGASRSPISCSSRSRGRSSSA